jgi:transformation/transcription domain-associated protein
MPAQQSAAAGVQPAPPPPSSDNGLKLLMMVLDLLKTRISNLGEQRRWFLSAVVQLIEKSSSLDLCRFLLSMMRRWILDQAEAFPTVKEKAGILIKMMSFETRDEMLLRDYLDLIHAIYASPTFSRTELTVRLENAFLLGCRQRDPLLRQRFIDIFDRTLVRSLPARLNYLLGNQSWEYLADTYWIHQALDLCLGSVEGERPLLVVRPQAGSPEFVNTLRGLTAGGVITPLRALLYTDATCTHRMWVSFFRAAWRAMPRKSQEDVTRSLIGTLTREHNLRQVSRRPNVVQTLLEGALACTPRVELPPQVVKYLGKTFNAWHTSIELLQDLLAWLPREDDSIREACQDALAELYAELSEDDMFYGLWRRRCVYAETNAAISYEQCGMWAQAQIMYESAQVKARTGVLTFTEAEYSLWEDHWVICAQKLQQWDILTDLAKLEGNNDLLLECAWRLSDWVNERDILEQALESLSTTATPRRRVFAAYMALLKSQGGMDKPAEFGRICDEAIQLALRKWHSLPTAVTQAHVPLLQIFQQLVELQEASTIFASLAVTNATNLDPRSTELKQLMQTWRERLPNRWDDINAWSDLVAWRQHVFSAVNKAYLPLVPQIQQNGATSSSTNSYAYRGYHETAWIVNRFAHVARKHYLNDVCISSLTKIYTLPNIEIQEAFLKLREQAKCHYRNPAELNQGLEVINNTNLMFFAAPQKAEFFTLKGMFMAKLSLLDEANHAFATAIQMDLNLAKAWTEWGRYNDRLFRDQPLQMIAASSAVSCYLQAAGLYKSSKVRKVLIRVLWLLSCDDAAGSVAMAFEGFRGEAPIWYWITFIPQLLQALQHREAKYARRLLMQIAKTFPQVRCVVRHARTVADHVRPAVAVLLPAHDARGLSGHQATVGDGCTAGRTDAGASAAAATIAATAAAGSTAGSAAGPAASVRSRCRRRRSEHEGRKRHGHRRGSCRRQSRHCKRWRSGGVRGERQPGACQHLDAVCFSCRRESGGWQWLCSAAVGCSWSFCDAKQGRSALDEWHSRIHSGLGHARSCANSVRRTHDCSALARPERHAGVSACALRLERTAGRTAGQRTVQPRLTARHATWRHARPAAGRAWSAWPARRTAERAAAVGVRRRDPQHPQDGLPAARAHDGEYGRADRAALQAGHRRRHVPPHRRAAQRRAAAVRRPRQHSQRPGPAAADVDG